MPQRRSEQRSRCLRRRDTGDDDHLHLFSGQLQRERSHRVNTDVTARDQRNASPGAGLGERLPGALDLVPRGSVSTLVPGLRRWWILSTYLPSPTTSSEAARASRARGGIRTSSPGPRLTRASRPRTGRRPRATVVFADLRFSRRSSAPPASTDASATLGVPTAPATTGEGFGTLRAASSLAE